MSNIFRKAVKRLPGTKPVVRALRKLMKKAAPRKAAPRRVSNSPINLLRSNEGNTDLVGYAAELAADYQCAYVTLLYRNGSYQEAHTAASAIPVPGPSPAVLRLAWDSLRDLGRYDLALLGLEARRPEVPTPSYQARMDHTLFAQSAYRAYGRYLGLHQPKEPKGYVVMFDLGSRVTTGLMVPISLQLIRDGYCVCSAVAGTMPLSSRPELSAVSGMIRQNGSALTDEPSTARGLHNAWTIEWDQGVVACDGINYFTFFLERISKLNRAYRGDIQSPQAAKLFSDLLRRSDLAISMCKRLVALAAEGKPVRIVTMETHFAPWGVVRRWCDAVGKLHGIHLVGLSVAYENYFSNLSSLEASTLSVEDMTARPDLRHPFLGGKYRFQEFLQSPDDKRHWRDEAMKWIKVDRSQTANADSLQREKVFEAIRDAKEQGKKVFAVLGKVLIDFAAPDDHGHVCADFPTWLKMLIELSARHDCILVIKPHPHEVRSEIVQTGVQMLRDLLPNDLPKNVLFLGHSDFNSSEIAELVDAAFVWNGTACSEFPVLGCPVFAESVWAARDYPLDSPILETLSDYEDVFGATMPPSVSSDLADRAAAHLHFMRSAIVSIPFGYVRRAGTNQAIGANLLYEDQLAQLEQRGDPHVELAASRFFEFE